MIAEVASTQSQAGPRLRLRRWCSRWCPMCSCIPRRTALGGRTQFRYLAESADQPELLRAGLEDARAARKTSPTSPNACRPRPGWCARSINAPRPFSKSRREIVRQQDGFFAQGVQHLRPLNLKTVADAIGMHESTVSRVTSNKYMATSRGIFEFKYFFTASIAASDGGEAHSAEAVRHRIRQLIDAESAARCAVRRYHCRQIAWHRASTSPAGRWRNTVRRCVFRLRCSAGARSRRRVPERRSVARVPVGLGNMGLGI